MSLLLLIRFGYGTHDWYLHSREHWTFIISALLLLKIFVQLMIYVIFPKCKNYFWLFFFVILYSATKYKWKYIIPNCVQECLITPHLFPISELNNANEEDILLIYSRYCPGAVEWAKYLHKLYLELSTRKGELR